MTLSRDLLVSSIRPFFIPATMPKGDVASVVKQWASAYSSYAIQAMAGPAGIGSPLVVSGASGRFSAALDSSLRSMWMAASWVGPAVVGVTLLVPPLVPTLESLGSSLITVRDPERALSAIADALHTYTLGITVTLTTAGGSSVSPVS